MPSPAHPLPPTLHSIPAQMHLQASAHAGLACYWSSWHDAARESDAMREFLGVGSEDKCLGYFIVAACDPELKDSRTRRPEAHLAVEWRD